MENKKAILGLDTIKLVLLSLLGLAVIAITMLLVFNSLEQAGKDIITTSNTFNNLSTRTSVNSSVETDGGFIPGTETLSNCALTVTYATNASGNGLQIVAANYTVSGCSIKLTPGGTTTDAANYNNTIWNLSGTWKTNEGVFGITRNATEGTQEFFGNTTIFFTLLAVVVIILIISIVVLTVNRFGGGGSGVNGAGPASTNI